ncbi:MAG TPA: hypothetical protein VJJ26_01585 [Candidatus Babeliales bacterium]|nr:hypothetical protein [Candidatus Babeliales bacterium]
MDASPTKNRIECFNQLIQEVQKQRESRQKKHVTFELSTRKGPRVDGDPINKANEAEKK